MIEYNRYQLKNGLRVLIHEDASTPLVAVNLLYEVGSRDESANRTGFAHLFEHLMFSGSRHAPNFDELIQMAGGENNAFTNSDITNFYEVLPAQNLDIALFLEADRMQHLNITQQKLDVQKKVVVEEFKETCLEKPYGDVWHELSDLAYTVHPYRWPTIGLVPSHISEASIDDVRHFYKEHYCPNNAVLVIAGNVKAPEALERVRHYFEPIPTKQLAPKVKTLEPKQHRPKRKTKFAEVPLDSIFFAFHMPDRLDPDFIALDLLSDILANGDSSRLVKKLYKDEESFSHIDAYVTGTIDPGLFVIEGRPSDDVSRETCEALIWEEIKRVKKEGVSEKELRKCQNKFESSMIFSEMNVLNKAINLAYFESLRKVEYINEELELYKAVTMEQIQQAAKRFLTKKNCNRLFYKAKKSKHIA